MNHHVNLKTTTLATTYLTRSVTAGGGFLLGAVVLVLFGLLPMVKAQDGDEGNQNTAEGRGALHTYISTSSNASFDTAVGFNALLADTSGSFNTATGAQALQSNTTGEFNTATGFDALASNNADNNTATGYNALSSNTTGRDNTANGINALLQNNGDNNTATGAFALQSNNGTDNTATGLSALFSNTTGSENTANGAAALSGNTTGNSNTATGEGALLANKTGSNNTATGLSALESNTAGSNNTADGVEALLINTGNSNTGSGYFALINNTSGSNNIAVGANAGFNLTTGSNNIDVGNKGVAGESAKIRIGTVGTQKAVFIAGIHGVAVTGQPVVVNTIGQLGVTSSSARFKDEIKPMDKASEVILALKPVTFRYKHELDPDGIPQFGLIAEEVEKVNPELVVRDEDGKVMTVRYEAVNAMLLNEFLKEHRKVEEQGATIVQQQKAFEAKFAQQQKQIEALTATVQKVSDQIALSKPAPQLVANP
jgi:trimeric autotransporter adhesin